MLHKVREEGEKEKSGSISRRRFEMLLERYEHWASLEDIVVHGKPKKGCFDF